MLWNSGDGGKKPEWKSADEFQIKPTQARKILDALLEVMKSILADGEDLMISGFGKFNVPLKM